MAGVGWEWVLKERVEEESLLERELHILDCINLDHKCYCAFHKHANSEVQKPTDDCVFRCRQSS